MNGEAASSKPKKLDIKTCGKSQTSERKALSDISNSGKPLVQEMKSKNSLKPSRVRDVTLDEIAEEMCFHDHQKCVKSQLEYGSVDVHQFFKTLENDLMNDGFTIYSPPKKMKSEIEITHWELEELPEELPAIHSPVRLGTPASSSSSLWDSPSRANPVQAESHAESSQWLCHVHNVVNRSLGKPVFPCERVDARWVKLDCEERACEVIGSTSIFGKI